MRRLILTIFVAVWVSCLSIPALATEVLVQTYTSVPARISSIAGTAFVDLVNFNLSAFASSGGRTPYRIVLTDSGSKNIAGYIGAPGADTGETLGSELHTASNAASDPNGNEANATTGWGTGGTITFTSDGTVKEVGSYSLKGVAGGATARFTYNFPFSQGRLMKLSFEYRHLGSGGAWRLGIASGQSGTAERFLTDFTSSLATFTNDTIYFNEQPGGSTLGTTYLYVYLNNGTSDGGAYLDNMTFKQVTAPSSRGATIVSTLNGSTKNWASTDTGFDFNNSSGYTVKIYYEYPNTIPPLSAVGIIF